MMSENRSAVFLLSLVLALPLLFSNCAFRGFLRPERGCPLAAHGVYSSECVVLAGRHAAAPGFLHVLPSGQIGAARIGSRVEAAEYAVSHNEPFIDFGSSCISPGLIDVHVHISALGERGWEGYASASEAAAAGGVTTVVGMPLNSEPATTTVAALEKEVQAFEGAGKAYTDFGFWGGIVPDSSVPADTLVASRARMKAAEACTTCARAVRGEGIRRRELQALLADTRILGLKAFLSPLPPSAGFAAVSSTELLDTAALISASGVPLLVHCEEMTREQMAGLEAAAVARKTPRNYSSFLSTRPRAWEAQAIQTVLDIARDTPRLRVHVVHLSDGASAARIAEAKLEMPSRVTVETCPHYLAFDAETIADGDTRLKCFPPIRDAANREALWLALEQGTIDILASDHSPTSPALRHTRTGDFLKAWAGISGLQFVLPVTWTALQHRRRAAKKKKGRKKRDKFEQTFELNAKLRQGAEAAQEEEQLLRDVVRVAQWWSEQPAKLAGLWYSKGSLEAGKDADFTVWRPREPAMVSRDFHAHAGTPYTDPALNLNLKGRVLRTFLRGREVFRDDDAMLGHDPQHDPQAAACGRILERTASSLVEA